MQTLTRKISSVLGKFRITGSIIRILTPLDQHSTTEQPFKILLQIITLPRKALAIFLEDIVECRAVVSLLPTALQLAQMRLSLHQTISIRGSQTLLQRRLIEPNSPTLRPECTKIRPSVERQPEKQIHRRKWLTITQRTNSRCKKFNCPFQGSHKWKLLTIMLAQLCSDPQIRVLKIGIKFGTTISQIEIMQHFRKILCNNNYNKSEKMSRTIMLLSMLTQTMRLTNMGTEMRTIPNRSTKTTATTLWCWFRELSSLRQVIRTRNPNRRTNLRSCQ